MDIKTLVQSPEMLSQTITLRNEWGNPGVKSHMGEFSLAIDVNVLPSINDLSCALCCNFTWRLCKAKLKKVICSFIPILMVVWEAFTFIFYVSLLQNEASSAIFWPLIFVFFFCVAIADKPDKPLT